MSTDQSIETAWTETLAALEPEVRPYITEAHQRFFRIGFMQGTVSATRARLSELSEAAAPPAGTDVSSAPAADAGA